MTCIMGIQKEYMRAFFLVAGLTAIIVIAYFIVGSQTGPVHAPRLGAQSWRPSTAFQEKLNTTYRAPRLSDMLDFHEGLGRGQHLHEHEQSGRGDGGKKDIGGAPNSGLTSFHKGSVSSDATTTIALGCAISTQGVDLSDPSHLGQVIPFFHTFLPSFCRTASLGFHYAFYFGYDMVDAFFDRHHALLLFRDAFVGVTDRFCVATLQMSLHFVRCDHVDRPAWAQNDAMLEAYLDGAQYYFRLNDDTRLETPRWAEVMISALKGMDPPNVGVVRPSDVGGNQTILSYDFVHRTHHEIFGFYYPRTFTNWHADAWMTHVYLPGRYRKLSEVKVTHARTMGLRNSEVLPSTLWQRVNSDQEILQRYLSGYDNMTTVPSPRQVISMSLYGDDPRHTLGAIRNAQLRPLVFPDWTLRIYTERTRAAMTSSTLPARVRRTLMDLGVEIVEVDTDIVSVTPMMWRFLVADDKDVDVFIVRDADSRLSERDAALVSEWLHSDKPFHCIRDHPSHVSDPVYGGLWGGKGPELRALVAVTFAMLLKGYGATYGQDLYFLSNAIWPRVKYYAYCHDSASCGRYANSHPIKIARHGYEHVGQVFDAHGVEREVDVEIMRHTMDSSFCQDVNDGNIDLQTYYRSSVRRYHRLKQGGDDDIRARPIEIPTGLDKVVIWTMDYDVRAVYDLKQVLIPLGVRFIDKSLSPDCVRLGTCATNLSVINPDNGMRPSEKLMSLFHEVYKKDSEMATVTHFLCIRPVAMCELYLPFNKTMILWMTDRYELGREMAVQWRAWNRMFYRITWNERHLIAASSHYDVEYTRYFTGIRPEYIPNSCSYANATYNRTRSEFLILPIQEAPLRDWFIREFNKTITDNKIRLKFRYLEEGETLPPSVLVTYAGIVHVPSQVSSVQMCELYRLAMPMFLPALSLMSTCHDQFGAMSNRTLNSRRRSLGVAEDGSPIGGVAGKFDPNLDQDKMSFKYWLRFADAFSWPYLNLFDSINHLVFLLQTVDLHDVSNSMAKFNIKLKRDIQQKWVDNLKRSL